MSAGHPLPAMVREAAFGRFPPHDSAVEVLPPVGGLAAAVVAFSGHNVIATALDPSDVRERLSDSDPGAPMNPHFLSWLAGRVEAHVYTPDVVLAASRLEPDSSFKVLRRDDLTEHPRVALANRFRRQVSVYSDPNGLGLLTLGLGPLGVWDVSIEVKPEARKSGLGRQLALAGRALVTEDDFVIAEVSPGNAASLRAFLSAGFTPICSVVLMLPLSSSV